MSRDKEKRIVLPATFEGAGGPIPRRTVLAYTGAAFATTLLPRGLIGCGGNVEAESVGQTMEAMITLSNATMAPKLLGPQPWAVILCHANDVDAPVWPSVSYFQDLIGAGKGGLRDYWDSVSRGSITLEGSVVFGWHRLAETQAQIAKWTRGNLTDAARAAATAAGKNLSQFVHFLSFLPGYPDGGGNGASVEVGVFASTGQPFWRNCRNCQMLAFWDGTRLAGACAGNDGPHDHTGSGVYAPIANATFPGGQVGWSRCRQCEAMIYGLNPLSDCPAGGKHNLLGSDAFALRLGDSTNEREQNGWRWCRKCNGLAFGSGSPGACPALGVHDFSQSGSYSVPFGWTADLGFLSHESGHGFGLDHSFGTGALGDFGNDNRPGAYGDGTDAMGDSARFPAGHFTLGAGLHAPNLRKLGWIPASSVVRFASGLGSQSVTISPLYGGTFGAAPTSVVMAQIDRPDEGAVYTVEYRIAKQTNGVNWDAGLDHPRVVVHRMQSMYMAGQNSWRHCASCEGLVNAGQTACPAGGVHDGSSSLDYGLLHNVTSGGQTNWRFCKKCSGLAFAGNSMGVCPSGGSHDFANSGNYVVPFTGLGEPGWRWCKKCQGLGFIDTFGTTPPGPCPAKGLHDYSASSDYVLGSSTGANIQNKWRRCAKCRGMYYAGATACAGHPVHRLNDPTDYSITNGYSDVGGQAGWRNCLKCGGLAFSSSPQGSCAGGGTHDLSSSASYTVRIDAELTKGQTGWFWCQKCGCLNRDGTAGPGVCKVSGTHERAAKNPQSLLVAYDTSDVPGKSGFRWCDRCCSLVNGASAPGCAAGGNHHAGTSFNYVVRDKPGTRVHEQSFWALCSKCNVLMAVDSASGSSTKLCGAGGDHSPGGKYLLTIAGMDPRWQSCRKCQVLALNASNTPGPCPAGGTHDHSQSSFYTPPAFNGECTVLVAGDLKLAETYTNPNGTVVVKVVTLGNDAATFNLTSS
jgi:hypothetical protein